MKYKASFHHNSLLLKLIYLLTIILIRLVWTTYLKQKHSNLNQHLKILLMRSKIIIWKVLPRLPWISQLSHILTRKLIRLLWTTYLKKKSSNLNQHLKNTNEIKANHLKNITSIEMNVSDITSNKHSSYYEYLKSNLMPSIILLSPVK